MKILICEDEEVLLTALEYRLRKHGFEVERAKNGEEALDILSNGGADLVVADLMMPKVNGDEVTRYIRAEMKSDLPVILITALEDDELVLNSLKLGANDFIIKPFKPFELILRIKRLLYLDA